MRRRVLRSGDDGACSLYHEMASCSLRRFDTCPSIAIQSDLPNLLIQYFVLNYLLRLISSVIRCHSSVEPQTFRLVAASLLMSLGTTQTTIQARRPRIKIATIRPQQPPQILTMTLRQGRHQIIKENRQNQSKTRNQQVNEILLRSMYYRVSWHYHRVTNEWMDCLLYITKKVIHDLQVPTWFHRTTTYKLYTNLDTLGYSIEARRILSSGIDLCALGLNSTLHPQTW